jgi:hypothetical protein
VEAATAVATVSEIISAMREAAPPGRQSLDPRVLGELSSLTQSLIAARPDAAEEAARFVALRQRSIPMPAAALAGWLGGATVLVTGGTGCIGSALMTQLAQCGPRRLVSVSRGTTNRWPRAAGVTYARADVRDRGALAAVFSEVRPDVVFHLAAQRDPGLAERNVHHTVTTNVLGAAEVIRAAEEYGVAHVVFASTGKALRPYSREVYTASKRAAEWLMCHAARSGRATYSAARFTHVVDNSIVYDRLLGWCASGVVRLHDANIMFYAQSALESAQLLLTAGLSARPGCLRAHALTNLGWPVSLLDLALGELARSGSQAPLYFSGYEPGYEAMPFPGLYDPQTAGEVSPLLNAFEAAVAQRAPSAAVTTFPVQFGSRPRPDAPLAALRSACAAADPVAVRTAIDEVSWCLLDSTLAATPRDALLRVEAITAPFEDRLNAAYQRILAAIRCHAAA